MKYYCIENSGELDIRGFYLMGVSSKDETQIGKFGTGNKYGIAALLRAGNEVVVFSGVKKFVFIIKKIKFRGNAYNQIFIKPEKGKLIDSGFTVEMGNAYWNEEYALREFVSNAWDEGGMSQFEMDEAVGEEGKTRIFVSVSDEVTRFIEDFDFIFTFNRVPFCECAAGKVFKKIGDGLRIYRKGVLVLRDEGVPSCFDYDFNEINVREDRSVDKHTVSYKWDIFLSSSTSLDFKESIVKFLSVRDNVEDSFEGNASVCYCHSTQKEEWVTALGGRVVLTVEDAAVFKSHLSSYSKMVLNSGWKEFFIGVGAQSIDKIMGQSQLKGWEVGKADNYAESLITKAVDFLVKAGYDVSRDNIILANNIRSGNMGAFIDGKIYVDFKSIKLGFDDVVDTIYHELCHKLSGGDDETRGFEDFLIKDSLYNLKRFMVLNNN